MKYFYTLELHMSHPDEPYEYGFKSWNDRQMAIQTALNMFPEATIKMEIHHEPGNGSADWWVFIWPSDNNIEVCKYLDKCESEALNKKNLTVKGVKAVDLLQDMTVWIVLSEPGEIEVFTEEITALRHCEDLTRPSNAGESSTPIIDNTDSHLIGYCLRDSQGITRLKATYFAAMIQ